MSATWRSAISRCTTSGSSTCCRRSAPTRTGAVCRSCCCRRTVHRPPHHLPAPSPHTHVMCDVCDPVTLHLSTGPESGAGEEVVQRAVQSAEGVLRLHRKGTRYRHTARGNHQWPESRSHAILTLTITKSDLVDISGVVSKAFSVVFPPIGIEILQISPSKMHGLVGGGAWRVGGCRANRLLNVSFTYKNWENTKQTKQNKQNKPQKTLAKTQNLPEKSDLLEKQRKNVHTGTPIANKPPHTTFSSIYYCIPQALPTPFPSSTSWMQQEAVSSLPFCHSHKNLSVPACLSGSNGLVLFIASF